MRRAGSTVSPKKDIAAGRNASVSMASTIVTGMMVDAVRANGYSSSIAPERKSDARMRGTAPQRSASRPAMGALTIEPAP